jgi:hypothetical protein
LGSIHAWFVLLDNISLSARIGIIHCVCICDCILAVVPTSDVEPSVGAAGFVCLATPVRVSFVWGLLREGAPGRTVKVEPGVSSLQRF